MKNEFKFLIVLTIIIIIIIIIIISMQKYMDDENWMPKEQKGCGRGSKGCKDQLLISKSNTTRMQTQEKEFVYGVD